MLHFYRFSQAVPAPVPARPAYMKRAPGKGWPEECPPLRAANAFGWDVPAATDMTFRQTNGKWEVEAPVDLESDWAYSAEAGEGAAEAEGTPLTQRNAWFWEENQVLPHAISRAVYPEIANQVKVSTFLFLHTDPNELLFITDIPNVERPFRVLTALVDADWYPASYPWHCVLELDRSRERITITKGEPLCRLFTVRRDTYFAREMSQKEFESFFQRTQDWLLRHSKGEREGTTDITGGYVKEQQLSRFSVSL
jgi:hypothetical protein